MKVELQGHVIDEEKSSFKKSIFSILIPESKISKAHIEKITYHHAKVPLCHSNKWNLNPTKAPKLQPPRNLDATQSDITEPDDAALGEEEMLPLADSDADASFSILSNSQGDNKFSGKGPGKSKKRRQVSTETAMGNLLHALLNRFIMDKNLSKLISFDPPPSRRSGRYWTSEFSNTPIPDQFNHQKPDMTLSIRNANEYPKHGNSCSCASSTRSLIQAYQYILGLPSKDI